jgi:Tol biopolymer transport system component/imidazolonepropionase-like amidohydrolase
VRRGFPRLRTTGAAILLASVIVCSPDAQAPQTPQAQGVPKPAAAEWDVTQPRGEPRTIDFTTDEGTWMTVDAQPDGSRLVFDLLGHIYALPAAGGAASLLTRDSGIALNFQPAISPDGTRIAFISDRKGQNNLWVMDADGTNAHIVEQNLKVRHSVPAWTPDSRFIVARRAPIGEGRATSELWLYHADGGRGVALTNGTEQPGANEPSVSADGRYVFFSIRVPNVDDPAKGLMQLRRLDLESGEVLKITEGTERGPGGDARASSGGGFAPRPSPDGKWLAFGRRLATGTISYKGKQLGPRTALWLRDLATGAERLLVDPIERDLQQDASDFTGALPGYAWSRDSRAIVIATGGKLRRIDVASGQLADVPFTARVERKISAQAYAPFRIDETKPLDVKFLRWPAVSPDGARVLFQAVGRLWLMDLPNGTPRALLPATFGRHQYAPAWSPDGQRIAFTSWTDDDRGQVWTMAAPGSAGGASGGATAQPVQPTQLTKEAGEYLNPVFSPDGRTIVVVRSSGATFRGRMLVENEWYDLFALAADGSGVPKHLVTVSAPAGRLSHRRFLVQPSFGPDGRVFYPEMLAAKDGKEGGAVRTEVRSIRLDGLDRQTHATIPNADEVAVSPDGKWLAFEEGDNVYLAAMPLHGIGGAPLALKREEKPVWALKPLSTTGGNYPRFASGNLLAFGSGPDVMIHDLRSGKTSTHRVPLQVERDRVRGALALRNARVITMQGDQVFDRGDVIIVDGRITAVGRAGTVAVPPGAHVLDLRGKTIIPGLVDMHAHNHRSPSGILPQRDYEMAALLAYGVTTTLDNSMWSQNIFPQSELVEAGDVVGPRVYSTGDPLYAGDSSRHNELKSLDNTRDEVRRLKSYGAVSLKQYMQPERRQRQWVSEVARDEKLMVTAEGGDLLYILSMVMDGQTGWEHPIPQVPVYGDVAKFIGQAKAFYSATLVVAGPGPWGDQFFTQERDLWTDLKLQRFAPWRKLEAHTRQRDLRPATDYTFPLLAQGLADIIAAGGHGAIGAHGQQYGIGSHWEIWMLASAMTPLQALRVATLDGATMLGVQEDIGSIAAGKLGDILVLNGNPLQDIRQTANIAFVIKGGRVRAGDTLDEVWPRQQPYGRFFWEMNEARPGDVKVVRE